MEELCIGSKYPIDLMLSWVTVVSYGGMTVYLPEKIERLDNLDLQEKIQSLIENKVKEDRFIDYKQSLNVKSDSDKKEFCKDVTGLANAQGGHIIYGIEESEGEPHEICGFDVEDTDKFKSQLQNILNSGVQPRLTSVEFKLIEVNGSKGNYSLIVSIPRSWTAPHMVIKDQDYRIYSRMNGFTDKVDIMQITNLILERNSLAPRIKNFRQERLEWLVGDDSPLAKDCSRIMIYHIIPINAFSSEVTYDVVGHILGSSPHTPKIERILSHYVNGPVIPNADGVFATYMDDRRVTACCQYFRNGIVEMVSEVETRKDSRGRDIITNLISTREIGITTCFNQIIENFNNMLIPQDIFIAVSLLGFKGCIMALPNGEHIVKFRAFDRNRIIFPEYLVNYNNSTVEDILQPSITLIWQAAGHLGEPKW